MQLISFLLTYSFFWLFSKLPLRILYIISDLMFILAYYVIGYRKKVVRRNLKLSFPNKPEKELRRLEKNSFKHFTDVFVETVKAFSITEKELSKRLTLINTDIVERYYKENKSIVIVSGHYANWEWVPFIVETRLNYHLNVAYKPLANKYFDKKIKEVRKKFGVSLFPSREFYPEILRNLKNDQIGAYGFIADQSPKWAKVKYWGKFMNIDIPVINGPEVIARKLDLPVFYFKTERIKRGEYQCSFVLLEESPKSVKPFEVTDRFIQELEKQIIAAPEFYFWTHKRFKHMGKRPS